MGDPNDRRAATQARIGYVADMLSQLAEMARSDGQLGLAVTIRLAALQASRAELQLRPDAAP